MENKIYALILTLASLINFTLIEGALAPSRPAPKRPVRIIPSESAQYQVILPSADQAEAPSQDEQPELKSALKQPGGPRKSVRFTPETRGRQNVGGTPAGRSIYIPDEEMAEHIIEFSSQELEQRIADVKASIKIARDEYRETLPGLQAEIAQQRIAEASRPQPAADAEEEELDALIALAEKNAKKINVAKEQESEKGPNPRYLKYLQEQRQYLQELVQLKKHPYNSVQEAENAGWMFSPQNKFSIGEFVVVPRSNKTIALGVITGTDGRYFVIDTLDRKEKEAEAKHIGKKSEPEKPLEIQTSSEKKASQEQQQLKKPPYKSQQEAEKNGWKFEATNNFSIGEDVVVPRSDGSFTLGIIISVKKPYFEVKTLDGNTKEALNYKFGKKDEK